MGYRPITDRVDNYIKLVGGQYYGWHDKQYQRLSFSNYHVFEKRISQNIARELYPVQQFLEYEFIKG